MKLIASSFKKLAVCAVALLVGALVSDLQAQAMKQSKAKVRAVRGQVQYKATAAAEWAPLKVGAVLNPGAIIQTGADSSTDLFLDRIQSVVRVTAATEIGLDKLNYAQTDEETVVEAELNLKSGTILGNVKKLAAASRYDVKIPNGVCGIRGTEFKVSADGKVWVVTGVVKVTYQAPGQPQIVVDVKAGEVFIPPQAGQPHQVVNIPPSDPTWIEIKIPQPQEGGVSVTITAPSNPDTQPVPDKSDVKPSVTVTVE